MSKFLLILCFAVFTVGPMFGQGTSETLPKPASEEKTKAKRGPVFRPTKDQIRHVQGMLKERSLYSGEASGTYNNETRAGIKNFQKVNGLSQTGTLNRATLEKMNVELTDSQKLIPVSENSYASPEKEKKPLKSSSTSSAASETKPKKAAIFRATADQIKEAQKLLKAATMYGGDETGKLSDETRAGLKKYQDANGLKATGTLNRITLEKMGIALTDKQKADPVSQ